MIMRLFIGALVILGLVIFLAPTNAKGEDACETPLSTIAQIEELSLSAGFNYELMDYSGVEAQSAREYVMSMVPDPQNVVEFDRIIMGNSDATDQSYVALYKDNCLISEFYDTDAHFYEIKNYVEGI